jgi:hypothetical protein
MLLLFVFLASSCVTNIFQTKEIISAPDNSLAYRSVVLLYVNNPDGGRIVGSGFAYDENRIMTAGHFCMSAPETQIFKDISMKYYDENMDIQTRYYLEIEEISKVEDLCMLRLVGHGLPPLKIVDDYSKVKIRDNVTIIGAPSGIAIGEFYGNVMALEYSGFGAKEIQGMLVVSAPSTGGVSGSPIILDKTGEVIGILVRGHVYFDHLSFGVNGEKIKEFISGLE